MSFLNFTLTQLLKFKVFFISFRGKFLLESPLLLCSYHLKYILKTEDGTS